MNLLFGQFYAHHCKIFRLLNLVYGKWYIQTIKPWLRNCHVYWITCQHIMERIALSPWERWIKMHTMCCSCGNDMGKCGCNQLARGTLEITSPFPVPTQRTLLRQCIVASVSFRDLQQKSVDFHVWRERTNVISVLYLFSDNTVKLCHS